MPSAFVDTNILAAALKEYVSDTQHLLLLQWGRGLLAAQTRMHAPTRASFIANSRRLNHAQSTYLVKMRAIKCSHLTVPL
jgi:hypothetical protein